ncbi:MAG: nitroreductase family protein [Polymorphobacter sp.]|uniref:nitroreductase family protein n=1 Tax=Polymorphobacter sp. TaxID=1909290 RepID=UPI003A8B2BAD
MREYVYDFHQFTASSSAVETELNEAQLRAVIVKEYHRLEKGLALPSPRVGFGRFVVNALFNLVPRYETRFGAAAVTEEARAALHQYRASPWCASDLAGRIDAFLQATPAETLPAAGAMSVRRDAIRKSSMVDFAAFAESRYSVRDFTGEQVPPAAIREAVSIAMKSPRVCNRGTTRCHAAFDPAVRARALALQNGNAGFGDLAGAVLVITSSRHGFTDFGERNQCWVDGGLFAMSLNYALHAAGYGTCMLNWSALSSRDRALRHALGISEDEAIITMMAVGVMKEAFQVAISPRERVEHVFHILDGDIPDLSEGSIAPIASGP